MIERILDWLLIEHYWVAVLLVAVAWGCIVGLAQWWLL